MDQMKRPIWRVTQRAVGQETEVPRDWQQMKAVTLPGKKGQGEESVSSEASEAYSGGGE